MRTASLVLLAGVLGVGCGASPTTNPSTAGAAGGSPAGAPTSSSNSATLSRSTPSSTAAHPAAAATATGIVRVFAIAYGRYLDGQLHAATLPDTTPAARTQAGPMIPPAQRAGPLTVQSVQQIPTRPTFMIALRDRGHTFTAQLTVARVSGRWLIVEVTPPDLDTILEPPLRPIMQPAGSGPAERAAHIFIGDYLTWLYGQAPLRAVRTATSGLLAGFKAHPSRVPPTMQALRPTITAIAMQRHGRRWQALANISDGRETYELVLTIAQTRGRWLVSTVSSPR